MAESLRTVSPVDGKVVVERPLAGLAEIDEALDRAVAAWEAWRRTPLGERIASVTAFVDAVLADRDTHAEEITLQMGRPIAQAPGELAGFEERARAMIDLAPEALADLPATDRRGFRRFIRREPLGVVLVLAAWNYPWLIAVNSVVPALLAGNVVLLKHSEQTPLVAERLSEAAEAVGLPPGVFQHVHASHATIGRVVADDRVAFVAFTGSVEGGRAVHRAAGGHFKAVGLELGGKDPAYVRPDADLDFTVDGLVDGAFFNSGQSCCGVERIYVHRSLYAPFLEAFVERVRAYRLGDPRDPETTLGPVVRASNAAAIRAQVAEALARGARGLLDPAAFPQAREGTPWVAPQVLVDVDPTMAVMREETFGPVVGIAPVDDDEEALRHMADSPYGLTASIWTRDAPAALSLGDRLETGTVFMNRCDVLDPELAWVGVKHSGRGCSLSPVGFEHLTRPKSFHLRVTLP